MMNRRRALLVIGAATLGGIGQAGSSVVRLLGSRLFGRPALVLGSQSDAANHSVDEALRKDLARIESRVNSEEGVPVFLGCVNLVVNNTLQTPPPVALTTLNKTLAEVFRQTAASWERIRPESTRSDVGHVIEVLAYRDFSTGGTEPLS